jgi:hypothetical protein
VRFFSLFFSRFRVYSLGFEMQKFFQFPNFSSTVTERYIVHNTRARRRVALCREKREEEDSERRRLLFNGRKKKKNASRWGL